MRTVFLHGEADRCSEAAAALSERFGPRAEAPGLITAMLHDKGVQDGLLTRWTEADVTRFLADVVPRRMVLPNWSAVPRVLHEWFDFLAAAGLLLPGSGSLRALHAAVDAATPDYLDAMARPAKWGAGKFWASEARERGVDPDDPVEFERFVAEARDGAAGLDHDLLHVIEEKPEPADAPAYWLPPVRVPDSNTPGAEAERAPVLERMKLLHEWVGAGRALIAGSEAGLDELAGALGTDRFTAGLTLEWAKRAHLVRTTGDRLVRTEISAALLAEPGVLWSRLWELFLQLEDVLGDEPEFPAGDAGLLLDLVQAVLTALYSETEAVPVEQVVSLAVHALADEDELTPEYRRAVHRAVGRVLDQWAVLGVVRCEPTELPERLERIAELAPEGEPDRTVVELTPLGVRAAHGSLEEFGFVVPTVAGMAALPAEVVVLALPGSPADVVEEVVGDWVARRGRAAASAELAEVLRRVDDPELRLGALWLLEHTGQEGVAEVLGLREDPLCGAAARMWLRVRPVETEVALQHGDELAVSLDAMVVTAQEDPAAFLADFQARPDQLAFVDELARTRHARADLLLGLLAQQHPDHQVSAAARRHLAHRTADEPA